MQKAAGREDSTARSLEGDAAVSWAEYRPLLLRFVSGRVRDSALAEDIVQDVLLRAWEHRHTLREQAKVLPWLYRITRNTIADHFRRSAAHSALTPEVTDLPEDNAAQAERELARCIQPLLERLPAKYRNALQQVDIEGQRRKELARDTGLSLSAAKSQVQRGRALLRAALLECCRVELDRRQGIRDFSARKACNTCSCS